MELQIEIKSTSKALNIFSNQEGSKQNIARIPKTRVFLRQKKELADKIAKHITDNLINERKYTGGKASPLKPSTIKRKGHSRIFFDKGILVKSIKTKKDGDNYKVYVADKRAEIAGYLQQGTDKMVARPFFGITKTKLNEYVKQVFSKMTFNERQEFLKNVGRSV